MCTLRQTRQRIEVIDLTQEDKDTCPICLNESDCIWQLPCDPRHKICIQCVGPLEKAAADNGQVAKCPFCRAPIDKEGESEVQEEEVDQSDLSHTIFQDHLMDHIRIIGDVFSIPFLQ